MTQDEPAFVPEDLDPVSPFYIAWKMNQASDDPAKRWEAFQSCIQAERDKVQAAVEYAVADWIHNKRASQSACYFTHPSSVFMGGCSQRRCKDLQAEFDAREAKAREEGRKDGLEEAAKLAYSKYVQQKCGASAPEDEKFDDGYIKAAKDIADELRALASAPKKTDEGRG